MNYTTLYTEARNIELVKDVGMIPYIMYKEFGFNSKIACYENGDYTYLNNEVKGLKIDFIKRYTGKSLIDGSIYLFNNAKNIDILNLFHISKKTVLWIFIYKLLNPTGKVYLKLDANRNIKHINIHTIKMKLYMSLLKKCSLISVETKELQEYIINNWPIKVKCIPNGFFNDSSLKKINESDKKNLIVTVGRIGSEEKANEILMEAFACIHNEIPLWKVKLIGPIEEKFKQYINLYFAKHPELREKVIFTGPIYDREKLDEEYRKAKIFCLTSPMEGFPLVFLEAIKNGCYIISSDVAAAHDVTNNEAFGNIFDVGDSKKLSQLLLYNCKNDNILNALYDKIQEYAYLNYDWKIVCKNIIKYLNS